MTSNCPSLDELSAFIDQKIGHEQQAGIKKHFDSCSACYELYLDSLETQNSFSRLQFSKEWRKCFAMFSRPEKRTWPFAIPAAAAVILLYIFWFQSWQSSPFPSSSELTSQLIQKNRAASLIESGMEQGTREQAFVSNTSAMQQAFGTGVALIDLELAKQAENWELAAKQLMILNHHLDSLLKSAVLVKKNREFILQIEEKGFLQPGQNVGAPIEAFFKNEPAVLFFQFGKWVESARLAAVSQNSGFFKRGDFAFFEKKLNPGNTPEAVLERLLLAKSVISLETLREEDMKRLENLLMDIEQYLLQ
ncbi:MAG: hypothetical protein HQM13_02580 [SAR324 cluster bacterium]|nr:hypothetical protein [SAR324 cluster bacterium]